MTTAPPAVAAPPSHPVTVADWLTALRTGRRYSPHTLQAYARDMAVLVEAAQGRPLAALDSATLRRALAQRHAAGASPRSLARLLSCWRSFYAWLTTREPIPANPADGLRAPKAPRSLPKAMSVEQTVALLEQAPAPTPDSGEALQSACDRAMFELLYSSGLRLGELVGLDATWTQTATHRSAGWLDLAEREVHVLGKGGKRRSVPVGEKAVQALALWLAVRPQLARNGEPALFVGTRGARIAPRMVQTRLAAWARRAGVPVHVHPHMLRHSFASHVLQSAQDLRAVQEMLGHASIATTQIYTRLDFQHLAAAYDQAHPRAGRKPPE